MGNTLLKSTFSRDRFKLLLSKLYMNNPEKPSSAGKVYYMEDLIECLKHTFQRCLQDSSFQSINESMTKFKARSTLEQYLPMKPIKRGIKLWMICDALTRYTYDMNVYAGKEDSPSLFGTLGERVVGALVSTIKETDVTLAFDRFFTSVNLMDTLQFGAVGTCNAARKNLPKAAQRLEKGESEFKCNNNKTLLARWRDTKEVILLSNCHNESSSPIRKKNKDGSRRWVSCPEAIQFYRKIIGSVDLADQIAGLYDLDRESQKWWKKVFYRCLMFSIVNSWVVCKQLQRPPNKPFLDFLSELAEALIAKGQEHNPVKRALRPGRKSILVNKMADVGKHLPIEGTTRRRCVGCSSRGKETCTKTLCRQCDSPYCKTCFSVCHM